MPVPRVAPADDGLSITGKLQGGGTYKIVTILCPSFQSIFFTSLMHATRLQALLEPRKRPSC